MKAIGLARHYLPTTVFRLKRILNYSEGAIPISVTRLGNFSKFLATNVSWKSVKNI